MGRRRKVEAHHHTMTSAETVGFSHVI
jgi:hypothetical protein